VVGAGGGGIHPRERFAQSAETAHTRRWIETWMAFPMAAEDGTLVPEATHIAERFQIGHFDEQILAVAKRMGCATVYSEDLNSGQDYGGVRVVNPFLRKD
jgi:predicted nucleic acid-binding protein